MIKVVEAIERLEERVNYLIELQLGRGKSIAKRNVKLVKMVQEGYSGNHIARMLGIDRSNVGNIFGLITGMTPTEYRKKYGVKKRKDKKK